jgi:Na+-transporting NADH:ubiquinone oxidoreductase subunit C
MPSNRDSVQHTIVVAFLLCVVCSVVVSTAAVLMRDKQKINMAQERQLNILAAAGIPVVDGNIDAAFAQVTPRLVDLRTGRFSTDFDVNTYDARKVIKDDMLSRALTTTEDVASIRRLAHYATIYLVMGEQGIDRLILPVYGYGLWSTLYGFIALEGDINTVAGLGFYEHAETPGLGGEVDNPRWRALWSGKQVYEPGNMQPVLSLVKGSASTDDVHKVDGLAGATLTSNGVTNLIHFWLGEFGFAPFLTNLKAGEA